MPWPYSALIPTFWALWLLYWNVAARSARPTQRVESARSRLSHLLPLIAGGVLMGMSHAFGDLLAMRLVPPTQIWLTSSAALVVFGLAFSAAARARLAGNWSSIVTIKADHKLIRSGPYRYVRHPIYSGLVTALLGTALTLGTVGALLGLALMTVAIVQKLTIEERFMVEQFGEAYARYRAEVPGLIPFVY